MRTHKINIKDFLPDAKLKKIEKAASHINEKGDLIKDRDYTISNRPDIYIDNMTDRKSKKRKSKIKRKTKGCGCK